MKNAGFAAVALLGAVFGWGAAWDVASQAAETNVVAAQTAENAASAADSNRVVVELQDDGRALINPGMGWTMHFYSNVPTNYGSRLEPSDALDWFEGCSTVYLRLPWAFLEPEEGVFNWSMVDAPAQRWIERGKKVAFRFTTSENWLEYATPKWVFDAGAKGVRYTWGKGPQPDGHCVDPEFDDPIYLEKLRNFLAAAGRRYANNPNVAFIDVGTYGMWGEGHSNLGVWADASFSRMDAERTLKVVKTHIDLHREFFPGVPLCISDDVAGAEKPGRDFPETDYALSQGVTLRDDSVLVQPEPRQWFHDELAQKFWPTLPVILEHEHYLPSKERGAWDDEKLIESVERYRASYMSIHWFPEVEWEGSKDAIRRINRRLGYRLFPSQVVYPKSVKIDEFFDVSWTLQNVGVAPCYDGGFVALTLKDAKGGVVAVLVDEGFDVKELKTAEPGQAPQVLRTNRFRVGHVGPTTQPGEYDVYVSVGKRDGTPVYELPLGDADASRRYRIGKIVLEAK